ncbi:hypothetical protein [Spirosoma agri]|uniref:Uncharacterized protein n=1 Tax=Spirosoma agri TaxID=1987381 RepID=A0A6M0IJ68_9BACT|nr:hypothetical protein [Spirosoma agri]NEU67421.1 hypothetical protein [Spirosoma agri]
MNYFHFVIALLLVHSVCGPSALPLIKANSTTVAINDGEHLKKMPGRFRPAPSPMCI